MLTQVVWGDNLLQHKWSWGTINFVGGGTVSCMTGHRVGQMAERITTKPGTMT